MKNIQRRDFISKAFKGIAGTSLLMLADKNELFARHSEKINNLETVSDNENYWELVKESFSIKEELTYFNNASLGPSPEIVIDATEKFRRMLDAFPSKYMWGGWNQEKEAVRDKTAALYGVSSEEIALIHNATEGMNLVARTIKLEPGDEVIISNHEHPSGEAPWIVWQERKGIKIVKVTLPLLPKNPGELVDIYRNAITSKTKVISMCHMVNTNGMILPVKEISKIAHEKGILVLVDGAQSAGMFDFNLKDLDCDFYTTSSHKWMHSPKGMGIFYSRQDVQNLIEPLIVSTGYEDASIRRFENYNTRNLPELLGLGTAIDFHNLISIEKKQKRIYELKHYFLNKVEDIPEFKLKTPLADSLSAGIMNLEILDKDVNDVQKALENNQGIIVRPMATHDLNGLRISLSIFNTKKDIDYLIDSLKQLI